MHSIVDRTSRWVGAAGTSAATAFASLVVGSCSYGPSPEAKPVAALEAELAQAGGGAAPARAASPQIGQEVAIPVHLQDGEEFVLPLPDLIAHGSRLFDAVWTAQEGAGRPLTKGVGAPLTDPHSPLVFPRNFNRVSAPDANACSSCHSVPMSGGGGHFTAVAFVPAQRFDFATFDPADLVPTRGAVDERGVQTSLQTIGNARASVGMFGSGFIEMLARQMTTEMQAIRDAIPPGGSNELATKGVSFGTLTRRGDGSWDVSQVEGLPPPSVATSGTTPPSLIVQPFHQSGVVISIRQFTNNAFNHHSGIQSTERFGIGTDSDGDGFVNEITRADITAASAFQATLPVPGRVIPDDPAVEDAVWQGEQLFAEIGCESCHRSTLPLDDMGWIFSEPSPFNPPGNLRLGEAEELAIDLTSPRLPHPRLPVENGIVNVPAYTDLKLHDITSGPDDPNIDPIDMNQAAGTPEFFAGTRKFLTKKLWGAANEPPFFHHGKFTTMREAILAHAGEAQAQREAFEALEGADQDAVIEFLKTLQVLPSGTKHLVVNERGAPKKWPRRPDPG